MDGDDHPDSAAALEYTAEHSVALGILKELLEQGKLTDVEYKYLAGKYRRTFEHAVDIKAQEQSLNKRIKIYQNDILTEKIAIEKLRIEEQNESVKLEQSTEKRNFVQKELEVIEQRDTVTKFELYELKKVHEELQKSLALMKKQNSRLVDPVLNNLKQEIIDLNEQYSQTEEAYERENAQKLISNAKIEDVENQNREKQELIKAKSDHLKIAELEPGRLKRQISSIENARKSMEVDFRTVERAARRFDDELRVQHKRREEAEKLRKMILEKLELNRQTLEEREQDVASVKANLDRAKAQTHDIMTKKYEFTVRKREVDATLRHGHDQLTMAEKDYEILKRQLKKKRSITDSAKQVLPTLDGQLKDQETIMRGIQEEKNFKMKEIKRFKDEVDSYIKRFMLLEGIEADKKTELESSAAEVDALEASVLQWLNEGKRQGKLISVLSSQRDIKARETSRTESKEKQVKQTVKIKELIILDLTKRCNEFSNRLKEFSALYEVVKNERNKYVNLIQSSVQALAEMREKIRILYNEVEILGNERTSKDAALAKEKTSHHKGQSQRDSLRQDLNRNLSEYRSKQSTVEQQIQEIDKLNMVINSLEKEMLNLKVKYEQSVEQRNVTGVQLIDRNDELCILYERSNQQQEALRKGAIETIKKEEELRLIRLQTKELTSRYVMAKTRLPQVEVNRMTVIKLEEQLAVERKQTDDLSSKLEDPKNVERWRALEGTDADFEQLSGKIKVLEDRIDKKREKLLEKELVLEEVTALTEKLRSQAMAKRDVAKELADELNEMQSKIKDVTKKMLATVSELSMYQATALRLQQEKIHREKALEDATWRLNHGEAPSEDAVKDYSRAEHKRVMALETAMRREEELQMVQPMENMIKTAAEPRPTAYIPDQQGIPKPYGQSAPFKPTVAGSTMRHIKQPVIKPVEI